MTFSRIGNSTMIFEDLPNEMLATVFGYVPVGSLMIVKLVSKRCNAVASDRRKTHQFTLVDAVKNHHSSVIEWAGTLNPPVEMKLKTLYNTAAVNPALAIEMLAVGWPGRYDLICNAKLTAVVLKQRVQLHVELKRTASQWNGMGRDERRVAIAGMKSGDPCIDLRKPAHVRIADRKTARVLNGADISLLSRNKRKADAFNSPRAKRLRAVRN